MCAATSTPARGPAAGLPRFVEQYAPDTRSAIGVGVGQRRDFSGGEVDSLAMSQLSSFVFDTDGRYRDNFQFRLQTVQDILSNSPATGPGAASKDAMEQAHQLVDQVQAASGLTNSRDYSNPGSTSVSSPARYMRDIAKLIRADFQTCVYYTGFGGFDTHGDQAAATTRPRATTCSSSASGTALRAFSDEMKDLGRWNDCVIMVISEFGRRNFENGSEGTDHGHAYPMLVTGRRRQRRRVRRRHHGRPDQRRALDADGRGLPRRVPRGAERPSGHRGPGQHLPGAAGDAPDLRATRLMRGTTICSGPSPFSGGCCSSFPPCARRLWERQR